MAGVQRMDWKWGGQGLEWTEKGTSVAGLIPHQTQ